MSLRLCLPVSGLLANSADRRRRRSRKPSSSQSRACSATQGVRWLTEDLGRGLGERCLGLGSGRRRGRPAEEAVGQGQNAGRLLERSLGRQGKASHRVLLPGGVACWDSCRDGRQEIGRSRIVLDPKLHPGLPSLASQHANSQATRYPRHPHLAWDDLARPRPVTRPPSGPGTGPVRRRLPRAGGTTATTPTDGRTTATGTAATARATAETGTESTTGIATTAGEDRTTVSARGTRRTQPRPRAGGTTIMLAKTLFARSTPRPLLRDLALTRATGEATTGLPPPGTRPTVVHLRLSATTTRPNLLLLPLPKDRRRKSSPRPRSNASGRSSQPGKLNRQPRRRRTVGLPLLRRSTSLVPHPQHLPRPSALPCPSSLPPPTPPPPPLRASLFPPRALPLD